MLLESPLDKLEPYQIFSSCLMSKIVLLFLVHSADWANLAFSLLLLGLQQEQPQFYSSLSSHLSAEEQGVIQSVVQQAEANSVAAQQQAQQLAAGANGGAS